MPNSAHNPLTDTDFKPAVNTASSLVSIAVTFRAMPNQLHGLNSGVSDVPRDDCQRSHERTHANLSL
jgi:hypothetical protein